MSRLFLVSISELVVLKGLVCVTGKETLGSALKFSHCEALTVKNVINIVFNRCIKFLMLSETVDICVLLCIFSSWLSDLIGSHPVLQNDPSRACGSVGVQGDRMH